MPATGMYVVRLSQSWNPPLFPRAVAMRPPELAPNRNKGVFCGIDLLTYVPARYRAKKEERGGGERGGSGWWGKSQPITGLVALDHDMRINGKSYHMAFDEVQRDLTMCSSNRVVLCPKYLGRMCMVQFQQPR